MRVLILYIFILLFCCCTKYPCDGPQSVKCEPTLRYDTIRLIEANKKLLPDFGPDTLMLYDTLMNSWMLLREKRTYTYKTYSIFEKTVTGPCNAENTCNDFSVVQGEQVNYIRPGNHHTYQISIVRQKKFRYTIPGTLSQNQVNNYEEERLIIDYDRYNEPTPFYFKDPLFRDTQPAIFHDTITLNNRLLHNIYEIKNHHYSDISTMYYSDSIGLVGIAGSYPLTQIFCIIP